MPTAHWGARALALVVVALTTFAFATGTPHQPDKKVPPKKVNTEHDVWFGVQPIEYCCNDAPPPDGYKLTVYYTTTAEGMEVAIEHSGKAVMPQDAPKGQNKTLTFDLTFEGDVSCCGSVRAILRVKKGGKEEASNTREQLCFLTGMMVRAKAAPIEPPAGLELANKAGAKEGGPVPKGFHSDEFSPVDKLIPGAQVRFWVQGRFKKGPPKMEYDRAATLVWQRRDGKWVPSWYEYLPEPLKAEPLTAAGEVPLTFVVVALLDGKGRVLSTRHYKHW